ncbi:XrtA system polysaccharide deacetylase [Thalassotalea maritima]|uniref:XrtA system polysaccharide deacetylase n=1 Tax=Thalassotalea maritima TaxID=3242416 RepID=UPI0035280B08
MHVGAMTVDVEDYFHVSAFEQKIQRHDWPSLPVRVEKNTHKILDLLDEHNAKATFFVLGWVAEHYPSLVQRIVTEGHELASHGYFHQRLTSLTDEQIKTDIGDSKKLLEDVSGQQVIGYRAPSFSISSRNIEVMDTLSELGFKYSSSTYPVKHDLYGEPNGQRQSYKTASGLLEIPMSTLKIANKNWPISGGGYFRLLPYWLSVAAIKRYQDSDRDPYVFYFHPWEIDPEQPRIKGVPLKSKFRHYTNLHRMQQKLTCLLKHHEWKSFQQLYFGKQAI